MSLTIRKATEADTPALSRICLLTANAGKSAEHLHEYGELPGLVFSVPYVKLPTTWAFVLVDESDEAIGYIVGSTDTRAYEKYAAQHWWPQLAEKYPPSLAIKPDDKRYMNLFQKMSTVPDANIAFAAAHLHINILKGRDMKGAGVCLGLDPRNLEARKFYKRVGFTQIEGEDDQMGLRFANYKERRTEV